LEQDTEKTVSLLVVAEDTLGGCLFFLLQDKVEAVVGVATLLAVVERLLFLDRQTLVAVVVELTVAVVRKQAQAEAV